MDVGPKNFLFFKVSFVTTSIIPVATWRPKYIFKGFPELFISGGRIFSIIKNRAEFWFEELDSLIDMVGLDPADVYDKKHTSLENPFLRCWFPNEEKVSL